MKAAGRVRGFTLVELLVAAGLTVVIVAVVLRFSSLAMNRWSQSAGRLHADIQARLVLEQLERDLQGALLRADGRVWMAVTILPDTRLSGRWQAAAVASQAKPDNTHPGTLALDATRLEDARFGVAGVWWRFFTTRPDDNTGTGDLSAPVAVGYQIVRRNVTSSAASEQRYLLFRCEVRRTRTGGGAPGTFEAGYDLNPAADPPTPYQTPNATTGDPGNLIRPPLGAAIADNVIDFGVRLYMREQGNLRLVFPARPAGPGAAPAAGDTTDSRPPSEETEHLARAATPAADDYYRHAFPEVADVMIRVLTDEGARLVAAYESGQLRPPTGASPTDYWWTLAEAHSRVVTCRIRLYARP